MKTETLNKTNHTPGPWVWDCKNHDNRERPFIRCTKNYFGAEKGASICKISTVLPSLECEANARIIASAPELLEALQLDVVFHSRQFVRDSIEEFRAVGYRGPCVSDEMKAFLLSKKQAAIAKATQPE